VFNEPVLPIYIDQIPHAFSVLILIRTILYKYPKAQKVDIVNQGWRVPSCGGRGKKLQQIFVR